MLRRVRGCMATRTANVARRACQCSATSVATASPSAEPTAQQLRRHAISMAVPMVGFGFMDNLVMIQAGDAIDNSIGVAFGLATLTSAAYGQIVSDVSGTLSSGAVEALASSLGLPCANLTAEQLRLRSVKISGTLGAVVGVAIGCLMGMSCLLFMDLEKSERLKKQRELRTLYETLMEEGHHFIGAQHCSLFLLDHSEAADGKRHLTSMGWRGKEPTREELRRTFEVVADNSGFVTPAALYHALRLNGWTAELEDIEAMVATFGKGHDHLLSFEEFRQLMLSALLKDEVRLRVRKGGSRDRVLSSGEILNVRDVNNDPRIDNESRRRYALRGYDVKSLLLAPIFDADTGEVIGLVELVNKDADADRAPNDRQRNRNGAALHLTRRNSEYGFSRDDERLLTMLCSHCSIFLRHLCAD